MHAPNPQNLSLLSKLAQVVTLLTSMWEVPGLNVVQDTDLRVFGPFLTPACKMLGETLN